jgi:hypothetical protein
VCISSEIAIHDTSSRAIIYKSISQWINWSVINIRNDFPLKHHRALHGKTGWRYFCTTVFASCVVSLCYYVATSIKWLHKESGDILYTQGFFKRQINYETKVLSSKNGKGLLVCSSSTSNEVMDLRASQRSLAEISFAENHVSVVLLSRRSAQPLPGSISTFSIYDLSHSKSEEL